MSRPTASASQLALSLLGASDERALSAHVLVGAAELLGSSGNAMRVALSRLCASGDLVAEARGLYALGAERRAAFAHVRAFRTGFAPRGPWAGGFVGVLTADLSRRNATTLRRRERALLHAGFRAFRHGVHLRPDNLVGGRDVVAAQLARLGLEPGADVVRLELDRARLPEVEALYDVRADAARAAALEARIAKLLETLDRRSLRVAAQETFWLGDEVLRFLARDPLLPESMADPGPRRALARAMATLDARGHEVWRRILDQFEPRSEESATCP